MRTAYLVAGAYLLAGVAIGLWLGPLMITSGVAGLGAAAWLLPLWLVAGLLIFIAWADKAGRSIPPESASPVETTR